MEEKGQNQLQRGEIKTITPFNSEQAINYYTQVLGIQTQKNGDKASTGLSDKRNKIVRRLAEEWLKTGAETRKQLPNKGFLGQGVIGILAGIQFAYDSDQKNPLQRTLVSKNPPKDFNLNLLPRTVQDIDLQALIDTFILYVAKPPHKQDANGHNRLLKLQRTDGYKRIQEQSTKLVPQQS